MRRDELSRRRQVHLVAVVLRRIVRRGHHHAGVGSEPADGEGQHRRGQRAVESNRRPPNDAMIAALSRAKITRVAAGIEADDDRRSAAPLSFRCVSNARPPCARPRGSSGWVRRPVALEDPQYRTRVARRSGHAARQIVGASSDSISALVEGSGSWASQSWTDSSVRRAGPCP